MNVPLLFDSSRDQDQETTAQLHHTLRTENIFNTLIPVAFLTSRRALVTFYHLKMIENG